MDSKETKVKPTYSMWQNCWFMITLAWRGNKRSVLWFILLLALFEVVVSLLGLFVAPMILTAVEEQVPLRTFILTVLAFVIPLMLLHMAINYLTFNKPSRRVDVRVNILNEVAGKYLSTSYDNIISEDFLKKKAQATNSLNGNFSSTEVIWDNLHELLKNILGFGLYLFILAQFNPLIKILIILTSVGSFFINRKILAWGYRHKDEEAIYQKEMTYIQHCISDTKMSKDFKLFGMKTWINDVSKSSLSLFQGFIARREKVYIWSDVVDLCVAFLRNGIAYAYLIGLVLTDGITAATFLLLFTAIGGFSNWITGILGSLTQINTNSLEISIVREFLDYKENFPLNSGTKDVFAADGRYTLELKNVTFMYPGSEIPTLENINLTINAGEKLAIVGVNGAGKSTLVKLICGLLEPTEGEILLNGVNINTFNRRAYYLLFSAVFQDFSVVAGTIGQNVAQSVGTYDHLKVEDALSKAGLWKKIESLPNQVHSNLEKSVYDDAIDLSGGQMQRLMLARALYKNAPILVLDEPTAALDPIAENEVYLAYNDLTKGKTAIYISHRLASTYFCDRIVMLDGAVVSEIGTHEVLLENGGKYAEMFEIQGKYYQENVEMEASADE